VSKCKLLLPSATGLLITRSVEMLANLLLFNLNPGQDNDLLQLSTNICCKDINAHSVKVKVRHCTVKEAAEQDSKL